MNWSDECRALLKKYQLLEEDMRIALERELGNRAARSLKFDGLRATWRHGGRTHTAATLGQLVDKACRLRVGQQPTAAPPVQGGFFLPSPRGGSRS